LLDILGATAFAPVKSDMNGNIKVHFFAMRSVKIPVENSRAIQQGSGKIRNFAANRQGRGATWQQKRARWHRGPSLAPSVCSLGRAVGLTAISGLEFTSLALRRNVDDPTEELTTSFSKV
jgi:hypothetical protein